ncbi:diguanylate cyclase [Alicyclobacillus ferrooxydans]|uniref:diguanylate cyclase n=1 Tax=Alicyclobacillus ferrooxydans TaxID=471514 RepID=UPI0006D56397|nr:diguanylate cyclase [Alicyclobacillus ferrooxydans]
MDVPRDRYLDIYGAIFGLVFLFLFFTSHTNVPTMEEIVAIVIMGGILSLFQSHIFLIPFTTGAFTLASSIIYACYVNYGAKPTLVLLILSVPAMFMVWKLSGWRVVVFNTGQIGLCAVVGAKVFERAGGVTGQFNGRVIVPLVLSALAYIVTNLIVTFVALFIRHRASFTKTIFELLTSQNLDYLILFFVEMLIGGIMAFTLQLWGIVSVVALCAVTWLLGITYRKYNEMALLAFKDGLTGLYNRRYFQENIERMISEFREVSLVMIDIDYFKKYNDCLGHPEGDILLQKIGRLLEHSIKLPSIACRYGGEEFAVVLPSMESKQAFEIAERVRKHVEVEFQGNECMPEGTITVSIGISTYPVSANNHLALLKNADSALYKAKSLGRNQVVTYTDSNEWGLELGCTFED